MIYFISSGVLICFSKVYLVHLRIDRVKISRGACLNVSRNDETLCNYTRCVSTHINTS